MHSWRTKLSFVFNSPDLQLIIRMQPTRKRLHFLPLFALQANTPFLRAAPTQRTTNNCSPRWWCKAASISVSCCDGTLIPPTEPSAAAWITASGEKVFLEENKATSAGGSVQCIPTVHGSICSFFLNKLMRSHDYIRNTLLRWLLEALDQNQTWCWGQEDRRLWSGPSKEKWILKNNRTWHSLAMVLVWSGP